MRRASRWLGSLTLLLVAGSGCGSDGPTSSDARDGDADARGETADLAHYDDDAGDTIAAGLQALPGPHPRFAVPRVALFDAPVPAPDLFDAQGHPDLSGWPRAPGSFLDGLVLLAETTDGASMAGSTFFALTGPLPDGALAGLTASYVRLDAEADAVPARLSFAADGGPHGAPNLLIAQPIQGLGLSPGATWALIVQLEPALRGSLGRPDLLADLLSDRPTPALEPDRELWTGAVEILDHRDIARDSVFALTVFRTQRATDELADFVAHALGTPLGAPTLSHLETHERFCVYGAELALPDYQHGPLPYASPGEGVWRRDEEGRPEVAKTASSRLFVTVPRGKAPAGGFPTVVFIRTGGGGDRPLIDRGPRATNGGPPIVPTGTGPAMHLAAAGWAGLTWDGPHGGPSRNPSGADEQFLMFNVLNLAGTRDSIRQTALEAVLVRELAGRLRLMADPSECPGLDGEVAFDGARTAIMGHSMGGWIAPIAMAAEPRFTTAILSGAGGGWMANIVYKRSPVDVRPLAEAILGYSAIDRPLQMDDPALTLLQWAGEAADPQSYAHLARGSRNILMIEGIVDTYILPPIAQATSLGLRLDLAGPAMPYATDPRLFEFEPLTDLLPLAGLAELETPVSDNRGGFTAVVVQAPGDGIEDGHEAAFQTPGPKHQYRCFLETLASTGVPTVLTPSGDEWAACDRE